MYPKFGVNVFVGFWDMDLEKEHILIVDSKVDYENDVVTNMTFVESRSSCVGKVSTPRKGWLGPSTIDKHQKTSSNMDARDHPLYDNKIPEQQVKNILLIQKSLSEKK